MAQSPLDDGVIAVKDFESLARDNVAPHIWNYLSDGAGDQQALLENEVAWQEPWFAGGFLWKWFINHPVSGGPLDNRFTPQNKPAQQVIRQYYRRNR